MSEIKTTSEELEQTLTEERQKAKEEATNEFGSKLSEMEKSFNQKLNDMKQKQGSFTNVKVKNEKVYPLGKWALASALGAKERKSAVEYLGEKYKETSDSSIAATLQYMNRSKASAESNGSEKFMSQAKSIGIGDIASGAGLGDPLATSEIVDALRPSNAVQGMAGIRQIQLVNGQAKINVNNGMTAYHVGSSSLTENNATFDQRVMSAKKVAGLSVIDNDRLRFGDVNLEAQIEADIIAAIRQEWDRGVLQGTGSNYEPEGFLVAAANSFTRATSPDATKIGKDLRKAKKQLQDDNIPAGQWYWVMRDATRTSIEDQYSTNQDSMRYAARLENDGTLMGYPVITSNNMPTGSDHSVLLVAAPQVYLGLGYGITIDMDSSRYFENDQSAIRGVLSYDVAYANPEAICKIGSTSDWETA